MLKKSFGFLAIIVFCFSTTACASKQVEKTSSSKPDVILEYYTYNDVKFQTDLFTQLAINNLGPQLFKTDTKKTKNAYNDVIVGLFMADFEDYLKSEMPKERKKRLNAKKGLERLKYAIMARMQRLYLELLDESIEQGDKAKDLPPEEAKESIEKSLEYITNLQIAYVKLYMQFFETEKYLELISNDKTNEEFFISQFDYYYDKF